MKTVTLKNCSPFLQADHYITEASELGISPTEFPARRLETELGNREPFLFVGTQDRTAFYRQTNSSLSLAVSND